MRRQSTLIQEPHSPIFPLDRGHHTSCLRVSAGEDCDRRPITFDIRAYHADQSGEGQGEQGSGGTPASVKLFLQDVRSLPDRLFRQ